MNLSFFTAKETTDKMGWQPTWMGENICKLYDWEEVNIQNIYIDHITQFEKPNNLI